MKKTTLAILLLTASIATAATNTWQWQATILPHAYVIEGLWSDYFRIVPALHSAGLPSTRITVNELTADDPGLNRYSVIVLGNVDILQMKPPRLARLKEFVTNGGGLVVLGGECAFSRGGYTNTPLEEILPVAFPFTHLIPRYTNGLVLTRAPGATWLPAFDGGAKPAAFYVHHLIPKSGAAVQLLAGDKPAVIAGTFGQGRVVAVGLTAMGEPPPGLTAFWDWPAWPKLLGQAIDWAAGARPAGLPAANLTPPLTTDELNEFALGLKIPRDLLRRALAHPNAEVAQAIFTQITTPDSESKLNLATTLPVLRRFAKPEWGERLVERTESFNPNRDDRNAALVLLGASRMPTALPRLLGALKQPESANAAIEALGLAGDPKAIPMLTQTFNQALRTAQIPNQPEWFRPEIFARDQAVPATEAALALYRLGDPDGLTRVLAMNRRVSLYLRIYRTAGRRQLRNWSDPTGLAILKNFYEAVDRLTPAWQSLHRHPDPIPASQIPAFVKLAQTATDPLDVDWLAGALERSLTAYPPATWQPLTTAQDGIIARLARSANR
ncbi:MAG: hypothetical protein PCFJNLEI_03840 [Verrucomicrobiae bacterium]|nr:hypothetical protein [Verrucomicrobiae bacterium]